MLNGSSKIVLRLRHRLCESLKLRVLDIPVPPALSTDQNIRVAVLFSGGLDCTVLARMIHDILPSDQDVDLINVAFENPRVVQAAAKSRKQTASNSKTDEAEVYMNGQNMLVDGSPSRYLSPYENCPDRETGRKAFKELQAICSARKWRFTAVSRS
jgi:asparagine synthetase B (glutamine-hydrolysing)